MAAQSNRYGTQTDRLLAEGATFAERFVRNPGQFSHLGYGTCLEGELETSFDKFSTVTLTLAVCLPYWLVEYNV
jgi:hypothetical protein